MRTYRDMMSRCENRAMNRECGEPSAGSGRLIMRSVPIADKTALAVIKLGSHRVVPERTLTGGLLDIAGVQNVHLNASCDTIQVLYDGQPTTAEDVCRFLVATVSGNMGHKTQ